MGGSKDQAGLLQIRKAWISRFLRELHAATKLLDSELTSFTLAHAMLNSGEALLTSQHGK